MNGWIYFQFFFQKNVRKLLGCGYWIPSIVSLTFDIQSLEGETCTLTPLGITSWLTTPLLEFQGLYGAWKLYWEFHYGSEKYTHGS